MPNVFVHPWRHAALIRILSWRDISGRYRGSLLGGLWALLTPLLMLAVFTFVFGVVAPTRWPGAEAQGMGMFALRLLAGMVVHGLLAELLQRAPTLVTGQPNYVTKVVFPLEVLGWVALLTALFHALMALLVLVVLNAVWGTGLSPTVLALPLIVLPYALLLLGLCWLLAALGVYLRDLTQLVGPLVMVCMFLGPVFYPRQAMPALAQPWLALNPITIPVEQIRRVLFDGQWPDWQTLAQYSLVAVVAYAFGLWAFTKFKKGFADVL
ncbi:MAG: ABC transporter permease [Xanthomonadaceae bacterium]|uniref:Transport permease protein n=1 Tax=Thermomonas beijingensis TaxID=2872701 RepID=A0ABS7TEZ4_9GAMM|nr:ABC transporter permease [Thermomonas beijingensis]MDE2381332.1 ABC transporter permease [Xanthomonadaceae bacterium]